MTLGDATNMPPRPTAFKAVIFGSIAFNLVLSIIMKSNEGASPFTPPPWLGMVQLLLWVAGLGGAALIWFSKGRRFPHLHWPLSREDRADLHAVTACRSAVHHLRHDHFWLAVLDAAHWRRKQHVVANVRPSGRGRTGRLWLSASDAARRGASTGCADSRESCGRDAASAALCTTTTGTPGTPGAAPIAPVAGPVAAAVAPAPHLDPFEQIKKLALLRDAGVLTAAEFDAKKAELLKRL